MHSGKCSLGWLTLGEPECLAEEHSPNETVKQTQTFSGAFPFPKFARKCVSVTLAEFVGWVDSDRNTCFRSCWHWWRQGPIWTCLNAPLDAPLYWKPFISITTRLPNCSLIQVGFHRHVTNEISSKIQAHKRFKRMLAGILVSDVFCFF